MFSDRLEERKRVVNPALMWIWLKFYKKVIEQKRYKVKKSLQVDDFDDDHSDSDDQGIIKTPTNKALKGKQLESDKKVRFQIAEKNTPSKTAKKENSVIKKKSSLAKGPKKCEEMFVRNASKENGQLKRSAQDDDEDDDEVDVDLDMILGLFDDDNEDNDEVEDNEDDNDEVEDNEDDNDEVEDNEGDNDEVEDNEDDNDEVEDNEDDNDEVEDNEDDNGVEQVMPSKKKNVKQRLDKSKTSIKNEKAKTPVKNAEKNPLKNAKKTPKKVEKDLVNGDKTPEKKAAQTLEKTPHGLEQPVKSNAEIKRQRDLKSLFLGNLPENITERELKALSSDILKISIRCRERRKRKTLFAFLEFSSEAKAEENFKILVKKKLRDKRMLLDFMGEKSRNKQHRTASTISPKSAKAEENLKILPKKKLRDRHMLLDFMGKKSRNKQHRTASSVSPESLVNFKRLKVSSLPNDATIHKVAKFFPKAFKINMHVRSTWRAAIVYHDNEKDAAEALEASKSAKLCGKPLTVSYAKAKRPIKKRKKKAPNNPPTKKMKVQIKLEK